MPRQSKEDYELSQMLLEGIDGISTELEGLIPDIDYDKPISDAKIKQAILDITPEALQGLYAELGQGKVIKFLSDFSQGRQW